MICTGKKIIPFVLLLFALILISGCTNPTYPNTPEGALQKYVKAVNDRDSDTVYSMLSSNLQSQYKWEFTTNRFDPVHVSLEGIRKGGATINSLTIINQTVSADKALLKVDFFWHYIGLAQHDEKRLMVEFVKENGEWKLNNLFPFYDPVTMV